MRSQSVIFSNARVKALETKLLSSAQFSRLVDAPTLVDAFKILAEFGYGQGSTAENYTQFAKILVAEEENAIALLREISVENSGLHVFILMLDYGNAKAVKKAETLKLSDYAFMLSPEGDMSTAQMYEKFVARDYQALYPFMGEALKVIDDAALNGTLTPRLIDNELDRAMFNHIFAVLKKTKEAVLLKYFSYSADVKNIFTFIRAKRANESAKFFEDAFVTGGTVEKAVFLDIFEQSIDVFKDKMKYTPYADIVNRATEEDGYVRAEAMADNMLLKFMSDNRSDMFSVAPIAGYYLARITEIRAVKLAVACIKNGVDKDQMQKRMRELYG